MWPQHPQALSLTLNWSFLLSALKEILFSTELQWLENNSNFQTAGNSQGRGHNSLSASNRNLLVCHTIWDHEPNKGGYGCSQFTNEVRSSEVGCRCWLLGQEQKGEWSCTRRYQGVFQKIPLRSCFQIVPSLPVTAIWTSSLQLPPGTAARADAPRRRATTLACHPVHWRRAQVNSPEANRYQESKNPSHRHLQGLPTSSSPLLSNWLLLPIYLPTHHCLIM